LLRQGVAEAVRHKYQGIPNIILNYGRKRAEKLMGKLESLL
jgi:hypothetical protein